MLPCRRRRFADPPSLWCRAADCAAVLAGADHRQCRDHAPGGSGRRSDRVWLVPCLGLVDFTFAGDGRHQLLAAAAFAADRHPADPGILLGACRGAGAPAWPQHGGKAWLAAAVSRPLRVGAWPCRYRLSLERAGVPVLREPALAAIGQPCRALRVDASGTGGRAGAGILDCRPAKARDLPCRPSAGAGGLWMGAPCRNPDAVFNPFQGDPSGAACCAAT